MNQRLGNAVGATLQLSIRQGFITGIYGDLMGAGSGLPADLLTNAAILMKRILCAALIPSHQPGQLLLPQHGEGRYGGIRLHPLTKNITEIAVQTLHLLHSEQISQIIIINAKNPFVIMIVHMDLQRFPLPPAMIPLVIRFSAAQFCRLVVKYHFKQTA